MITLPITIMTTTGRKCGRRMTSRTRRREMKRTNLVVFYSLMIWSYKIEHYNNDNDNDNDNVNNNNNDNDNKEDDE